MPEIKFFHIDTNKVFATVRDLEGFRHMYKSWRGDFEFNGVRYDKYNDWRGREKVENSFENASMRKIKTKFRNAKRKFREENIEAILKETWFEFMDRAKRNGISPTLQEKVDREFEEEASHVPNNKLCRTR